MGRKHRKAPIPTPPWQRMAALEGDLLNVIIETPQGFRNKIKFDPAKGLFTIANVLTIGSEFPYDFGFVPGTMGEDGDPLDVLVLMDAPTFPGCWVPSRLLGVIEARQKERRGKTERNDRLLGVASGSQRYRGVHHIDDLGARLLSEIEHFFVQYNQMRGKEFDPIGRRGPKHARRLVEQGAARVGAGG